MTFFSYRLLTTFIFPRRLSSVLSNSATTKFNFIRVSPLYLDDVHPTPLPNPQTHHALAYQILAKLDNTRLSYCH